jgi:hypothetical protein
LAEDIEKEDFEECLVDFMEYNFNMLIEDNSAKEVSTYSLILVAYIIHILDLSFSIRTLTIFF